MINVQECYLIIFFPQHEENRLNKLDKPQHDAEKPESVYAKHFSMLLAGFDILDTFPCISEGESMIMELMATSRLLTEK